MKDTEYLSVVLVVEDISTTLVNYIEELHHAVSDLFSRYEVIIVCNSVVGETQRIHEAAKKFAQPTCVITLPYRHAVEVAGYVGLEYAKGDCVFEVEYIEAHFPKEQLREMITLLHSGSDIVAAVVPERSSWASKLFYRVLHTTSVLPISLETEYYRLVTRRVLNALFILKQRTKYRKLLYAYTGFTRATIIHTPQSSVAKNSMTLFDRINLSVDVFIAYTTIVMRATLTLALLFFLLSIFGGVYALLIYMYKDVHIEGWTTLMLFTSLGLSGIFLILSLMVKYLESILRETQSAPLYVLPTVVISMQDETHNHV
jgi:dolichol-phosphate mannosyltransferase